MAEISYNQIKQLFIKYNYLPTEDLIWRTYISLEKSIGRKKVGQDVYSICLDGPAGAGKSSFAKAYSKILEEITGEKVEFVTYSCNTKTGKEEIFEDVKLSAAITQDPENLITPGFIAKVINLCNEGKRVVLRVDEYDKAKPETDSYMLEFLQEGRISSSQSGELILNNPEKLQVILCKNDYRAQLSPPLTRRLNFVNLTYTTPEDMAEIIGMNMKEQAGAIKLLVGMIYATIYKDKDDYTRIPSASEVMIAIDEADILTKGGASKQYVYKNIINNLFKSPVDVATFTSGNKKDGKLNEDIENMKMMFNEDSEESFDKQALLLDLYEMYFKPLMDELKEQMQMQLEEICQETNEFKSSTDYKLLPIEIGQKQQSKFELSDSWFLLGEVTTDVESCERLIHQADEIKIDGPVFVVDDDYYITAVKENLNNNAANLKFLSNKPAIPTAVVIKLNELVQYMKCSNFEFSFPLITQYKFSENLEKQHGFYEYSTNINKQPTEKIFKDIVEVKLNNVKLGTGKIIEGKGLQITNFGKGDKVLLKSQYSKENIQVNLMDSSVISQVQDIISIPFEKPIIISKGKTDLISYDADTKISRIRIKSKKKGVAEVDAFEPERIVAALNEKNHKEAEVLNDSLLAEYALQNKQSIFQSLDDDQKQYLSNFIGGEPINNGNINQAIANCIDYCRANDVLNENSYSEGMTKMKTLQKKKGNNPSA